MKQWLVSTPILIVGFLAFIVLAGDETPNTTVSLQQFILVKAAAFLVIYACYHIGRKLYKAGYFPEMEEDEEC